MNITRILCPECKGEKECMYLVKYDERELQPCRFCGGEGIVIEITETIYKRLTGAVVNTSEIVIPEISDKEIMFV